MKCFDVVQKVLDATYAEIPGDEDDKDAAISKALRDMSSQYQSKLLVSGGPDFSDPVTRFAYVFLYVPANAHWLNELIEWSPDAKALFENSKVRITCLGGGPGSDLVGALKYIDGLDKKPAIFCEIVDGCIDWKRTWSDLAFSLDWPSPLHTDYIIHDVGDEQTWESPCSFAKADIFTVSFFASEIYHLGEDAKQYLLWAFKEAKPNALVLMNDNNASKFYDWFDQIADEASLEEILSNRGNRKIYDTSERASAVGSYAEKFDWNSKLTGNLAWRVYRKK